MPHTATEPLPPHLTSQRVLLLCPRHLSTRSRLRCLTAGCYFVQKSLPLLEDQIRESHLNATEELRQCGEHIPNTDADKMFFLVEVRTPRGAR